MAPICFRHWLQQSNVLFIIGGKSNNTDIYETLRAMTDALGVPYRLFGFDSDIGEVIQYACRGDKWMQSGEYA